MFDLGAWHAEVQETLGIAMAPSQEEKSHTNGAQEIPKSVNRWDLCLPTVIPSSKTVDSGAASEGDLLGIKSRPPSAGGADGNRGLWYTLIGLFSNP
jgi:hypothetical protein